MGEEVLAALIFLVAGVYSLAGHGGASGYLAVGVLAGLSLTALRGQALALNLLVSGLAIAAFWGAARFRLRLFAGLALGSMPAAYLSARYLGRPDLIRFTMALALFSAAVWVFRPWPIAARLRAAIGPWPFAPLIGAVLGVLSGMTGVGGGIYLSPFLLLVGWADMKETARLSAAFIFLNSAVSLAGLVQEKAFISPPVTWMLAALLGGSLGSFAGARLLPLPRLRQALSVILLVAGAKLVFF